jgi:hypothetical protein
MPATITLTLVGECSESLAPLYIGQDSSTEITVVIAWDATNGCFILTVEGASIAPEGCQQVMWVGFSSALTGVYTHLCDYPGGCNANANLPTLTVS